VSHILLASPLLALPLLQEVRDEYGGGLPVMLYAVRPHAASPAADGNPAELRRWRLNEGLSLALLAPMCSTYTVVAPPAAHAALPLLRWQPGNLYHASAICAAALDTATLPYRLAATGENPHSAVGEFGGVYGCIDAGWALHHRHIATCVCLLVHQSSPFLVLVPSVLCLQAAPTCGGSPSCSRRSTAAR
jgi:hypothetical protein